MEPTATELRDRGVYLALLKIPGFIRVSYADKSPAEQESMAVLLSVSIGLVVGTRDVHTARMFMEAIKAVDAGLVENVADEIMRVLEKGTQAFEK